MPSLSSGDRIEDTSARQRESEAELARLVKDMKARGALGPDLDSSAVVDIAEPRRKCPVHGVDLETGTVPIAYGFIVVDQVEADLAAEFFPLARTEYLGGCVVRKAKQANVRFCPRCRLEQQEFRRERLAR